MGKFSDIFTSKSGEKTVDGIYNGIDKAFYTDEEKADMVIKQTDMKLKLLPLFEPFKLAQRFIAILFSVNFILAFWVGVVIWWFGKDEQLESFTRLIGVFNLGWIMTAIITWYFSGGVINSLKSKDK